MTDPGPYDGPDRVRATVEAQVAEAAARTAAVDALADRLASTTATVRSLRGEVEVVAEPSGAVRSVRIADDALELYAADLGRLVTETIARAQREAADRALAAAEDALGSGDGVVAQLRDGLSRRPSTPGSPPSL
jgi:DNA-binding protein YbaB